MTMTEQPQPDRPDSTVIAAQNDAFRKLACLGVPPAQPIHGRMHVNGSIMEAGDGFMVDTWDGSTYLLQNIQNVCTFCTNGDPDHA